MSGVAALRNSVGAEGEGEGAKGLQGEGEAVAALVGKAAFLRYQGHEQCKILLKNGRSNWLLCRELFGAGFSRLDVW